jgi:L-ascorbate metabolism protein UlaG (beta-lactamase superfamily)
MRLAGLLLALALTMAPLAGVNAAELRFLGHAALKLRADGRTVLVDPHLTGNPVAPDDAKDLAAHGDVDLILLTHGHPDHLGDTAALVERTDARVALNADLGRSLAALGIVPADRQVRFNIGGTVAPLDADIAVTMVEAVHSSTVAVPAEDGGGPDDVLGGGAAAGYVIRLGDDATIYHAGDTAVFRGMSYITEYYEPDVAFLPAGGRETMGTDQAAHALMNYVNVRQAVPMHFRAAGRDDAVDRMRDIVGDYPVEIVELEPGETWDF